MAKRTIKVGNIVLVKDDSGNEKIARVLNISRRSESAIVMFLNSAFEGIISTIIPLSKISSIICSFVFIICPFCVYGK